MHPIEKAERRPGRRTRRDTLIGAGISRQEHAHARRCWSNWPKFIQLSGPREGGDAAGRGLDLRASCSGWAHAPRCASHGACPKRWPSAIARSMRISANRSFSVLAALLTFLAPSAVMRAASTAVT